MTDDANGRVTLARIDGKIDMIIQRIDSLCGQVGDHETRMRTAERWNAISSERWEKHGNMHEDEWDAHGNTHNLERGIIGTVVSALGIVTGWLNLR